MVNILWTRRAISYRDASQRIRPIDPLSFLTWDAAGTSAQDAVEQIHGAVHTAVEDVEKAFQMVFDQLNPEANVADRTLLDANSEIRNEQARARGLLDYKQDDLIGQTRVKLQNLYIQALIQAPQIQPAIRRWENLSARTVERNEPLVSEFSYDDLDSAEKRIKRLNRWKKETDVWLETLCQNHVRYIVRALEEQIKEYVASWVEVTDAFKKRASRGGELFQQVNDIDQWNFESEDPTVTNLLNGGQALDVAGRILDRFQMTPRDAEEVAHTVRVALLGTPVFGANRASTSELEELLALAISEKIRDTVSVEAGFLSLISNGLRFGEDLGELLDDMRRGAAAMEEKLWRVGEVGVGHVDSASGVGVTAGAVHDLVLRGLGGGRKFAAVEGHPGNNYRFDVQMSIVGAPASDLTIFREMVHAWYSWHFEEDRGSASTRAEWLKNVMSECWKLYPDIGVETGVRNAIVELIDDDLKTMGKGREGLPMRPSPTNNGLPGEQELLNGLWEELGIITDGKAARV
jgi:hypothetical protein